MKHPIVVITMENGTEIEVELYPEEAPNTVSSFLFLAGKGCFDNHAIERIAHDFVADISYTAFGKDEAKYLIAYETADAGFPNHLPALPGTIVMGGYEEGIAGGEFFFPFLENERLTWHYPAFGKVTRGMEEIMRWNTLPLREVELPQDPSIRITAPVEPPVIRSVRVETFGVPYPEPVRLEKAPLPVNWRDL